MADSTQSTTAPSTAPAPQKQQAAAAVKDPPVPETEQAADTYADDNFSRAQLIRHARTLLDAEPFVVEVALRHAGGADLFTVEDAKAAVAQLLKSEGSN